MHKKYPLFGKASSDYDRNLATTGNCFSLNMVTPLVALSNFMSAGCVTWFVRMKRDRVSVDVEWVRRGGGSVWSQGSGSETWWRKGPSPTSADVSPSHRSPPPPNIQKRVRAPALCFTHCSRRWDWDCRWEGGSCVSEDAERGEIRWRTPQWLQLCGDFIRWVSEVYFTVWRPASHRCKAEWKIFFP